MNTKKSENRYGVISFASTHSAILARSRLSPLYYIHTLSTPDEISLGCDISIRFRQEDLRGINQELHSLSLPKDQYAIFLHHPENNTFEKWTD